jgi:hypothetical protein
MFVCHKKNRMIMSDKLGFFNYQNLCSAVYYQLGITSCLSA